MNKLLGLIIALWLLGTSYQALADPIDVTYSVSGSSGNWILDFSFTNNLPGTNDIYLVMVAAPNFTNIVASPTGWGYTPGDKQFSYNVPWCIGSCVAAQPDPVFGINSGQTLSGFELKVTDLVAPTSIGWMAYSLYYGASLRGPYYNGPGCFDGTCGTGNPGFEGVAVATPLPAALPLFASGLAGLGWLARRKKQGQAGT